MEKSKPLRQIYGEAQVTAATVHNSLQQCRRDAKDEMLYQAAVANTQQNLFKNNEIVTQQAFENEVQNQLKQATGKHEDIVARIENRYPNPAPIPPLSDGMRDYKIKAVEDAKALERAAGGKTNGNSKKW